MTAAVDTLPPVLSVKPGQALGGFLRRCQELGGIDIELVHRVATETIAYLRANPEERDRMAPAQELERRWYESLERGEPDWSVYAEDAYLGDLWACWVTYSRSYLRAIKAPMSLPARRGIVADLGRVDRAVDLGCGFGYTTAALRGLFPVAQVIGTNLDGIAQTELARVLATRHRFQVVSTVQEIRNRADLVFASEYFEHIPSPVAHLREIAVALRPRAMLIANTFGTRSIGHFDSYEVDGEQLDGKATSGRFNAEMRDLGYVKIETRLWNHRPTYWKLTDG